MTSEEELQAAEQIIRYLIVGIEDGWYKPNKEELQLYNFIKNKIKSYNHNDGFIGKYYDTKTSILRNPYEKY